MKRVLAFFLILGLHQIHGMSRSEKAIYRDKVVEMFDHAYNSYMTHAYPADELMPLSCKGRVRGRDTSRGDIDDALGDFSLTLVDTLDTLAVLGKVEEFNSAIVKVIRDVTFDANLVVSVFETNIRMLGGLLGAHFAAVGLKARGQPTLQWYTNELAVKAEQLGQKLLPAFSSATGLPYARINIRTGGVGRGQRSGWDTTCTACAGSMILEFAALSRLTGNPAFEEKAHKAMEVLWDRRNEHHHLVGNVINVTSGEWINRDSGVGAGIDSYYEYCLKSYIMLGDEAYRIRFEKHYSAIMKFVANGPFLIDCNMNRPQTNRKNYMDSLLAFWPGLQVLWGDIDSAVSTHDLLYFVNHKHHFLPEAFNVDMRGLVWANHPLRPEFSESTYFLYKATGDPYYLDIGKSIIENLNRYARVPCGFAAVKDVRTKSHEDRMDSFVLAETFKYLYLLFAEEEDLVLPIDDYIFTTEAHLLSLSLSRSGKNVTSQQEPSSPSPPSSPSSNRDKKRQETRKKEIKTVKGGASDGEERTQPWCPVLRRGWVEVRYFEHVLKKQTSSPRFVPSQHRTVLKKDSTPSPVDQQKQEAQQKTLLHYFPNGLDVNNVVHQFLLKDLGILISINPDNTYLLNYNPTQARSAKHIEDGLAVIQSLMFVHQSQTKHDRANRIIRVLHPPDALHDSHMIAYPAYFGPDLAPGSAVRGVAVWGDPLNGCSAPSDEVKQSLAGKIVVVKRGDCSFMAKVRNAQLGAAAAVIVVDNFTAGKKDASAMAADGSPDDIQITSVFLSGKDRASSFTSLMETGSRVEVEISVSKDRAGDEVDKNQGQGECTSAGSKETSQQGTP